MVSFGEAVGEATRLALCSVFAGNEAVNALLSPIAGDAAGFYPAASALRRRLCSDDPTNDPEFEPPFTGGQCPGTTYQITCTTTVYANGTCAPTVNPFSTTALGPIRGPFTDSVSPPPGGPLCAGTSGTRVFLRVGAGQSVLTLAGASFGASVSGLSVTPITGPDNCGDILPDIGPPGNVPYTGPDITYNIDESTEITVPFTAVFAPVYVKIDGSINVPLTLDVGGLTFKGEVTISPEFNLNITPDGFDTTPGVTDDPDELEEPGEPPADLPPEDEQTPPIIGVLVYSDIDPDGVPSGILFVNGPNLYVPRLASVQFAIKTRNSIGWTSDLDVKNLECYVPCPAPQGAIAVRVSPMPGVTTRFSAVRGQPLTEF